MLNRLLYVIIEKNVSRNKHKRTPLKTLIFLRHGKTAYTGQFPDLTDEGKEQIGKAAAEILNIVGKNKDIRIVSSPLPRALGTADIIAKKLGYPYEEVDHELAVRCMDFYSIDAANAIWSSFSLARDVDRAYASDPRFEQGVAIEKRSAIQHRFFTYLGSLFERFVADKLPDVMIHTSHYEVLWNLAAMFGFEEPLIHGEVIKLDLTDSTQEGHVHVRAAFREYSREFDCKLPTELFASQFKA